MVQADLACGPERHPCCVSWVLFVARLAGPGGWSDGVAAGVPDFSRLVQWIVLMARASAANDASC